MDYLSLCLICKDENDYLPEWLDYHILVGVERFYIFDNASQVSLRESLKAYIQRGRVVVVDIPGQAVQLVAYDNCLRQFGSQTRWMGFIDADEFLVPKTAPDLKELLKAYEEFGGLAVSSLFFGSNGHKKRPQAGQLASYTLRTPPAFPHNKLIKSIVQPDRVLRPYSPHDFDYKDPYFCVNEQFQRVYAQDFANSTEKIQLNHYYCRSESEIAQKLSRGRGDAVEAQPRQYFDNVNCQATAPDLTALALAQRLVGPSGPGGKLLEQLAERAQARPVIPLDPPAPFELIYCPEIVATLDINQQRDLAHSLGNHPEEIRLLLKMLQIHPGRVGVYPALALIYLKINDPASAWQALAQAWQLAPDSSYTLMAMVYYFIRTSNFEMAEKSCHLLLGLAPRDLTALGLMTEILLGQGRFEEALKIGVPVVEMTENIDELPEGMRIYLVKKLAGCLSQQRDYAGAARLWETGLKSQPEDVDGMLAWIQALLLNGEKARARQVLARAQTIAPHHAEVLHLLRETSLPAAAINKKHHHAAHHRA